MSINQTPDTTLLCPNGHETPYDSDTCRTCGLPMLDYDAELARFLDALGMVEGRLSFSRRLVFLGVGDQGGKLVRQLHRSSGDVLPDSEFLIIDSSREAGPRGEAGPSRALPADHRLPHLSHHFLPASSSKQIGYFGSGESLAASDPHLDDRLLRAGIRPSSNTQTVFVVSALGGGTGSGAAPYALHRAKAINPQSRSVAVAMMPSADEPHSAHFNAFCALSRLLGTETDPLADIILLADHDRLAGIRGIDSAGEEIARETLLAHMLAALAGTASDDGSSEADPSYLAKVSSSVGVQVFVPCVAVGRSLEIFGTMDKILDSALSSPLAPIDKESVMLSYMAVQVPNKMATSLHEKTLRAQLNRWNSERFPRLKGSVIQLSQTERSSERVDLCLLLGGTKLAVTAKRAEEGFRGFKSVVGRRSWEQEFGVSAEALVEIEKVIKAYDAKLDEMTD